MPGSSYLRSGHDRLQIGQRQLAEQVSGPDPTDVSPTDFTWYEWEESAEVVSGKVPLALPAIGAGGDTHRCRV